MREVNGWWLPDNCSYFDSFLKVSDYKRNGFQREHLDAALGFVTKWDYAIDVGAHVGFWASDMVRKFGTVYCLEPSPDTFACLAKNMAEFNNAHLMNIAVGDKPGFCKMTRDENRAKNSGSDYVRPIKEGVIRMCSIDSLNLPGCDFLKIDVEGFELAVLRGAKQLIRDHWPVISMECDKKFASRRYGWPNHEAEAFLIKRGYERVFHMKPDKVFVHRA